VFTKKLKLSLVFIAALFLSSHANAQTTQPTVRQYGSITPGHAVIWNQNQSIKDGGPGSPYAMSENGFYFIGDSRQDNVFFDHSTQVQFSNINPFNWANSLLGQPFIVLGDGALSGSRTDQMLASQLAGAVNSTAKNVVIQSGVNDISQGYPSTSTSGATACANIKTASNKLISAGKRVFLYEEYGSTNFSTTYLTQLALLRRCEEEYAQSNPGNFINVDFAPVLYSPTNSNTTSLVFNTGYTTDGTHDSALGAYFLGVYLKGILQTLLPNTPVGTNIVAAYQDGSVSGVPNLAQNPLFLNTTAISGVTGFSGTQPTGWNFSRSGTPTVTVAVQPNTEINGLGNETVATITCSAASDQVYFGYNPGAFDITATYQGIGSVYVEPNSSILTGIDLGIILNTNAGSALSKSMTYINGTSYGTLPPNGYSGRFITKPIPSLNGSSTQGYSQVVYEVGCYAPGTVVVHFRPASFWKVI
jgi:hypothetical protein